jgi:hypothetical protein
MARTVAHWRHTSGEGNWSVGSNWDIGTVPTASDNVHLIGSTAYQVDLNTAEQAFNFSVDGPNIVFDETATGSLTVQIAQFTQGTAILDAGNTIDDKVQITDGLVELNGDDELGQAPIYMQAGGAGTGTIEAVTDVTLTNALYVNSGRLEATDGHMLTVAGYFELPAYVAELSFGAIGGDANGMDGTVEFTPSQGASASQYTFEIDSGTVTIGKGAASDTTNIFENGALKLYGGTLDVANFLTDSNFYGLTDGGPGHRGSLSNTGAAKTFMMYNWNFSGAIASNIHLVAVDDDTLGGTQSKLDIAMSTQYTADLDTSAATGTFNITSAVGSDATIHVGTAAQQVDRFYDFQDGGLTIDTAFAADVKVSWVDYSDGVERLVIHPGHGSPSQSLYFKGIGSHADFVLGDDGSGHLEISYAAPADTGAVHDAAVADAAAQASFVLLPHDVL